MTTLLGAWWRLPKHFFAGQESLFIIRPQWSYNYGNEAGFIKFYKDSLAVFRWIPEEERCSVVPDTDSSSIFCFSFPRTERLNVLLHANLGHELGHIAAGRWLSAHFNTFWKSAEPAIRKAAESFFSAQYGKDDLFKKSQINEQISQTINRSMEIAKDAIKELISDAVAIHVLGPAAYSAALEIAARYDPDASPLGSENYPPWRYRLRLMWDLIKSDLAELAKSGDGFVSYTAWLQGIEPAVTATHDKQILNQDFRTKQVYTAIEAEWPNIRTAALSPLNAVSDPYRIATRTQVLRHLIARLEDDVPPNEYGQWPKQEPASFEDIFNAGWIRKRQIIEDDPNSETAFDNLSRLVLKALESSQIQQTYGAKLKDSEPQ